MKNSYLPFSAEILDVIPHTRQEYTFRMAFDGPVKPGQFFQVSLPKYGEAPISVSGIGPGVIDMTIRRVGRVTGEIFENYVGDHLFLRGPYGNGFDVKEYRGKEIIVVAGGTGLSPVRGVVEYFSQHREEAESFVLIAGFKSPGEILFKDDICRWKENLSITITVDQAEEGYEGKTGLVTAYIPQIPLNDVNKTAAIVVGPPVMMKFAVAELLKRGIAEENVWISQERKMCCGIGKCGHCKIGNTYICLDGPVFQYTKGKALID